MDSFIQPFSPFLRIFPVPHRPQILQGKAVLKRFIHRRVKDKRTNGPYVIDSPQLHTLPRHSLMKVPFQMLRQFLQREGKQRQHAHSLFWYMRRKDRALWPFLFLERVTVHPSMKASFHRAPKTGSQSMPYIHAHRIPRCFLQSSSGPLP